MNDLEPALTDWISADDHTLSRQTTDGKAVLILVRSEDRWTAEVRAFTNGGFELIGAVEQWVTEGPGGLDEHQAKNAAKRYAAKVLSRWYADRILNNP
ncbi:hypothetical protein [Microbispora sp. NPDC049125]|uniref:hypothetical protein n=1 Tax=Microbispora sp. NPDC049125 TaxID=3154929 RepID=UPI0034662226